MQIQDLDLGTSHSLISKSNELFKFLVDRNKFGRFSHICFINKIFEFIKPQVLYRHIIERYEPNKLGLFDNINFGWTYTANLKSILYKPFDTFLHFENFDMGCICNETPRLEKFLMDIPPFGKHVLTIDLTICENSKISNMLIKGLNHIPKRDIQPFEAFLALWDGWLKVASMLDIKPNLDHKTILYCKFHTLFSKKFPHYKPNTNNFCITWVYPSYIKIKYLTLPIDG